MPKPVLSFRAKPSPRARVYVDVKVFASLRDMKAYGRRLDPPVRGHFNGLFRPVTVVSFRGQCQRTSPQMGEILLEVNQLGAGAVSHECMHAALAWAWRRRLTLKAELHEELACYALTNLVRTIYRRIYRAGLIVESRKQAA
jgi:hypothetical protein